MASSDVSTKRKENTQRPYHGAGRMNYEENNPCLKEGNLSSLCMSDNNYNKKSCEIYFLNYKKCKVFWGKVMRTRRSQGLLPHLPLPEDRAEIKAKWFESKG